YNLPVWLSRKDEDCYLQAIRSSRLLGIPQADFERIKNHYPELNAFWGKQTEYILRKRIERERLLLKASPEERWKHLMNEEPELIQHIPKVHLAAYLGLRPETLSRIRKY